MRDTDQAAHSEHAVVQLLQRADAGNTYTWAPDVERAVSRGTARRRRVRAIVGTTGAAMAVASLVAVTAVVSDGLGNDAAVIAADIEDVPLTISALDASVPVEEFDASILEVLPDDDLRGVVVYDDPDYPSYRVWLLSTPDGDVCVAGESSDTGAGGGGECLPREQMLTDGVVSVSVWPDRTFNMTAVLPDGYTTARVDGRTFDVVDNVAVVLTDKPPAGELEVTGPGVPTVRWPVTDFWGPTPGWGL
ncbi:hypothetical protein [Jannaschia sp. R86511]|uniref:hypothetical protein n=1 Tax=Jannaschia sp. R86511 TaxID=3093853 RepID=UPI0036D2903F